MEFTGPDMLDPPLTMDWEVQPVLAESTLPAFNPEASGSGAQGQNYLDSAAVEVFNYSYSSPEAMSDKPLRTGLGLEAWDSSSANIIDPFYHTSNVGYQLPAFPTSPSTYATLPNLHPPGSDTRPLEKIHACPAGRCNKMFARKSDAKRHGDKYGARKFQCDVADCDQAFYRSDKLGEHHKKIHG